MEPIRVPWTFGDGALRTDGVEVPVVFGQEGEPGYCEGTLRVRALDGNRIARMAARGVNIDILTNFAAAPETDGGDAADRLLKLIVERQGVASAVMEECLVSWSGIKRSDGTTIEYTDEARGELSGYLFAVFAVLTAAVKITGEIRGNSESSSSTTTIPSGENGDVSA